MEKLENENLSLELKVQSLIKEQENVKLEYQKLFDSIKKTRTQTQEELNELIEHVNQKAYAYADVRAENQDLLMTISELKTKLKNTEKGLKSASSIRRPSNRDSPFKNSVLSNTKKSLEKVKVYVRTNKKTYVASKNVVSNKKIVTDVDVNNALKAKDVLCVTCVKNVLFPCHDKCLANYTLNVHSKVRRALFTTPRTSKSMFEDTTPVVSKTSGCLKHMTGDRSLLKNFVKKFMGTVCFGNDHFAAIIGYGDYVQGSITLCHVYYVEGLRHNLFSVGKFCDGDLEVAFRSNTCYVRNREGDDFLIGAHESNLYTISISDMTVSSPVCLLSKATSTNSWLWHRRLSHLNFEYFEKRSSEVSINSAAQQAYNIEDLPSTSSIIVEEQEAPPIVTTSKKQTSPISINNFDEFNQEDFVYFDGNTVFVPYDAPNFEEAGSSTIALDPSNMHKFHQV
ncbi:integrase, catalytic region, zinc finger, CCHC-type containing protein [Tanacetum coccineum]